MSKKILFLLIFLSFFLINLPLAYGEGIIPKANNQNVPQNVPSGCADRAPTGTDPATYCGMYEINDFIVLAINIARWILGIVGSLSLVMFIYGGFMFLISAGSSESVTKGKNIITAAVVGLIIVFSSYLIIKFVLSSMGLNWKGGIEKMKIIPHDTSIKTNS